jgi:hypothetical protein
MLAKLTPGILQMRKKAVKTAVSFCAFGTMGVKAARKMLMKSTSYYQNSIRLSLIVNINVFNSVAPLPPNDKQWHDNLLAFLAPLRLTDLIE